MRVALSLSLPPDPWTVAVAREVTTGTLDKLGILDDDIEDIRLALSEACTNVVRHSGTGNEYQVMVEITQRSCEIRVVDSGRGADFAALGRRTPDPGAPGGRGLPIIEAVVDRAEFHSDPPLGTAVHLLKTLRKRPGAP